MRLATLLCVFALLGLVVGPVMADKIPEGKEWHYDLTGRTTVPEVEPNDTCPGQPIVCGDVVDPAALGTTTDVDWYEIELTEGMWFTVGTDAGLPPDCYDTRLYIYDTDCLTELAFDDDGGPGFFSLISNWVVPATGTYHIKVTPYPYTTPYTGSYILMTECVDPIPPPENDTCDGAIELPRCSFGQFQVNLGLANPDYSPGEYPTSCTGWSANGPDVVYVMYLEEYDVVDLSWDGVAPAYADLALYIITDCADPVGSCVIGEDGGNPEEILDWVPPAAGTYYVIADAYSSSVSGIYALDFNIECPGPPTGACCVGEVCSIVTEDECVAGGGDYQGDDVPCDPNPCLIVPVDQATWGQIKSIFR